MDFLGTLYIRVRKNQSACLGSPLPPATTPANIGYVPSSNRPLSSPPYFIFFLLLTNRINSTKWLSTFGLVIKTVRPWEYFLLWAAKPSDTHPPISIHIDSILYVDLHKLTHPLRIIFRHVCRIYFSRYKWFRWSFQVIEYNQFKLN